MSALKDTRDHGFDLNIPCPPRIALRRVYLLLHDGYQHTELEPLLVALID